MATTSWDGFIGLEEDIFNYNIYLEVVRKDYIQQARKEHGIATQILYSSPTASVFQ